MPKKTRRRGGLRLKTIRQSTRKGKKFDAVFELDNGKEKTVPFGAKGMSDYTIHKDPERKQRYINRHSNGRENWDDPTTAGSLSRYVLWEDPSFDKSVEKFKKKFNL